MNNLTVLSGCLLLALAGSLYSAEPPRYGAEDFLPTPQTPIGFQADGNGWYPGATPQVVEWWDGKPGWGKVVSRGGEGNQSPPFDDSSYKEMDLRVFTDKVPKNILWKIPTPGHSDAQPVIVGDRIICTFYPHFTVCYDLKTGKELWRDAMEMAFLPELGKDRKTVGPTPDPAEARKKQTLFAIATAMSHLTQNLRDFEGEDPGPAEYPLVQKAIERMGEWRKTLEEVHPSSVALLDEDIALAKRFLAGEHGILGFGQKKMQEDRDFNKKVPQFGDPWVFRKNLVGNTAKLLNAPIVGSWPGWMPYHVSSPCSDGKIVVVRFCHGQIGALEVATGRRLWAWRDTAAQLGWTWHVTSPRIKGDLVFLDSIGKRDNKHAADAGPGMLGIDKRTGAVRWFSPGPGKVPGYPICTPVLMDVIDGSTTRSVLVNWDGDIIDQTTGKRLGNLPEKCLIFESHPLVIGDRVLSPHGISGGRISTLDLRLRGDGQGGLTYTTNSVIPTCSYRGAWVRNDQLIMPHSYDFRTGYSAGDALAGSEHTGPSIIGPLFVTVVNRYDGSGCDYKFRPRRDGVTLGTCVVADTQVRPHDAPRLITDRNLLGGAEVPANVFYDTYLAGFDKLRQIAPKKYCGRYGGLLTAYFGHCMNGPVARGNRIFIQSQCFLYCIGPAVQGTPTDDPQVVAAIRAGKDVEKHLTSPSAQYRYEAVKKAKGPVEVLKRLFAEDPYEEIRMAAMAALDAADPAGQAGWQALVETEFTPAYATDIHWGKPGHRDQQERRKVLPLLFRCLGQQEGSALIARRWPQATKDPVQRRALIEVCTFLRWRVEPMYTEAVASLATPRQAWPVWYFAAVDAAADPQVAETLIKVFPAAWELYPVLARNLKPDRLLAWIEPIAIGSSHPVNRPRIFTAWKAIGAEALPSIKRVKAAVEARTASDNLAAEYAKAIDNIALEMK
jgi:outer membrane protein assembly factor BamB